MQLEEDIWAARRDKVGKHWKIVPNLWNKLHRLWHAISPKSRWMHFTCFILLAAWRSCQRLMRQRPREWRSTGTSTATFSARCPGIRSRKNLWTWSKVLRTPEGWWMLMAHHLVKERNKNLGHVELQHLFEHLELTSRKTFLLERGQLHCSYLSRGRMISYSWRQRRLPRSMQIRKLHCLRPSSRPGGRLAGRKVLTPGTSSLLSRMSLATIHTPRHRG